MPDCDPRLFPQPHTPLLERPFADRKRIVLAPQRELAALVEASSRADVSSSLKDELSRLEEFDRRTLEGAEKLRQQMWTMSDAGRSVVLVSSAVCDQLSIPTGGPDYNVIYVVHPRQPRRYIPADDFHEIVLQQKFAEAIKLAQALGAYTLEIDERKSRSIERGWGLALSLPRIGRIGFTPKKAYADIDTTRYCGHYKPRRSKVIPSDLIWFSEEPVWQAIAEGRIHHGLQDFALEVVQRDDYGVDRSLFGAAQRCSFKIGKWSSEALDTAFVVYGEFYNRQGARALLGWNQRRSELEPMAAGLPT